MNTSPPSILVIRSQIFTMANPAAFIVLCAYTCSILLQLPRGGNWGSNAHSPHQIWPNAINLTAAKFRCGGWHTQHNSTASIVRNHLCLKPRLPSPASYTMPATSAPAPLPTFAKATGGSDMKSGFSVATSVTGFTTNSGGVSQEDLALVAKLQQIPVHAPPWRLSYPRRTPSPHKDPACCRAQVHERCQSHCRRGEEICDGRLQGGHCLETAAATD